MPSRSYTNTTAPSNCDSISEQATPTLLTTCHVSHLPHFVSSSVLDPIPYVTHANPSLTQSFPSSLVGRVRRKGVHIRQVSLHLCSFYGGRGSIHRGDEAATEPAAGASPDGPHRHGGGHHAALPLDAHLHESNHSSTSARCARSGRPRRTRAAMTQWPWTMSVSSRSTPSHTANDIVDDPPPLYTRNRASSSPMAHSLGTCTTTTPMCPTRHQHTPLRIEVQIMSSDIKDWWVNKFAPPPLLATLQVRHQRRQQ
jgi:hypothetical protein